MPKPHTGIFINCKCCNKSFYIRKHRIGKAFYCSRKCHGIGMLTQLVSICEVCKKEFNHLACRANKAKYCSRKCYYKARKIKNQGTKEFTCKHCGIKFNDAPSVKRVFCSKKCVGKDHKSKWSPSFSLIRKRLLRRGMISSCSKCGYDKEINILGIHHKDRNRDNNSLNNLLVLCPTCHSIEHQKHIVHGALSLK